MEAVTRENRCDLVQDQNRKGVSDREEAEGKGIVSQASWELDLSERSGRRASE